MTPKAGGDELCGGDKADSGPQAKKRAGKGARATRRTRQREARALVAQTQAGSDVILADCRKSASSSSAAASAAATSAEAEMSMMQESPTMVGQSTGSSAEMVVTGKAVHGTPDPVHSSVTKATLGEVELSLMVTKPVPVDMDSAESSDQSDGCVEWRPRLPPPTT